MSVPLNPAENLLGSNLNDGWVVTKKLTNDTTSGGNFSVCYLVKRDGVEAFLKAQDLSRVLARPDFMKELERLAKAHNYEVDLLNVCAEKRLSKVVTVLCNGIVPVDPANGIHIPVNYMIFEMADKTARTCIDFGERLDNAWKMQSLHNITVGLSQLHKNGIAHQDLKPSNVLLFQKTKESKIADLGRAESKISQSIYYDYRIAGDPSYSPPEFHYYYLHPDWNVRRQACDLYQLGSLLTIYYSGSQMTTLLLNYLPPEYNWFNWGGDYYAVLPYLNESFESILRDLTQDIQGTTQDEKSALQLIDIIRQLCHPDPERRGHPTNAMIKGNKYSLERYITSFARLRLFFEYKLL